MFLLLSLSLLIMSQHSNKIVHLSIASASMCDISVMPGISLMLAISAMSTMFAMSLDCQVCHICYVFLNLVYISHLEVSIRSHRNFRKSRPVLSDSCLDKFMS